MTGFPSCVVNVISLATSTFLCSVNSNLLIECFYIYVGEIRNSNLNTSSNQAPWEETLPETIIKYHVFQREKKPIPVSLDLLFSWSSCQLQCLEDLLFLSFQSVKKREIIYGL
jgi:hypothetical protein